MNQIQSRPPNYEKILAVLPGASRPGVIFAYAPDVYVPSGKPLPPELVAHEAAHIARQVEFGVEIWWDRYLAEPKFRYAEELIAHACEYHHLISNNPSRNVRRTALKHVAKRLASDLYSGGVTTEKATKDILGMHGYMAAELAA